ncbi:TolC family protein [Pedobacter sp. Leaf250]|uniref:TolC family protein n=1 Tax=Pedobacter sp. Leaf250 TaxID=2876559 RepID=UPI001E4B8B03|nr:TolC family protein [Pedobacter sp. Leaf250]
MNSKWCTVLLITLGLLSGQLSFAQQTFEKVLTVEELFSLVKKNHPTLKTNQTDIAIANQNVAIAKNQLLPQINTSLQATYLGDVNIIDKDFSTSTRVGMPHFGNRFSVDATQLIWKGNAVRNGIKTQTLREQLATLSYELSEQNIKLLVLSYYLDLYKLNNQEDVYRNNIDLAVKRLANINKFYAQGMVTRNDVIRGELQISNLQLAFQTLKNDQDILNKQLTVALGLDENFKIVPSSDLLPDSTAILSKSQYQELAKNHPSLLLAQKTIDTYDVSSKIIKSEMLPSLSVFAGNNLQRPITTANPIVDMYSNSWNVGLSLNFSIDALYKSPKRMQLNTLEKGRAINQANEVYQNIDISLNKAFIKYNEAITQNKTLKVNTNLTAENYRIMESKYNNQLAILLDLIDASNSKIDSELELANSEINTIFAYYKLLREAGTL